MASRRLMSLVFVFGVFAMAGVAGASTYSSNVEYTAGSGGNEAFIAVDFDSDNSFLFAYRWDDVATGWDALHSIDLAGVLSVNATDYGDWGMFVNDLDYPGGVKYDYGSGVYAGWAYYTGNNESWSLSGGGVSFCQLNNGDWNSWVWTNYNKYWMPVRQPGQQPIPEPCTIVLLAFGGWILQRRRS